VLFSMGGSHGRSCGFHGNHGELTENGGEGEGEESKGK
jgi:hypothetical protein